MTSWHEATSVRCLKSENQLHCHLDDSCLKCRLVEDDAPCVDCANHNVIYRTNWSFVDGASSLADEEMRVGDSEERMDMLWEDFNLEETKERIKLAQLHGFSVTKRNEHAEGVKRG
ncbi:hypothetical protein AKJ16_DCAP03589 [Drosera capensis]